MLFGIFPALLRRWSPPLSRTPVKTDRETPWLDVDTCCRALSLHSSTWEAPANELYFQHTVDTTSTAFPPEATTSTLQAADFAGGCLALTVRS